MILPLLQILLGKWFVNVIAIEDIPKGEEIKLYRHMEYTDMCRGPHVPNTKHLRFFCCS